MQYKTALYGRTSRDDAKRLTIEIQQKTLRDWSARDAQVESVVEEFWDADVSGKLPLWERSAGKRMLDAVNDGRVKSIAVVYLDRFGRTLLDSLQAAAKLEQQGVKLIAVNDGWDARRDDDPLYFHIRAAIAESEHRRIKSRTTEGRRRAAERDNAPPGGSLIFGYRMGPNGRFLVDPVESAIVSHVFRMAADGRSHSEIITWIQSTGVSPGRRWQKRTPGADVHVASHHASAAWRHSRIGQILRQRAYIGERVYGGRVYPVPPIVDRDTWDLVQEICSRYTRQRASGPIKGLLSGLILCGRCNTRYHHMSNGGYAARYSCVGRRRGVCDGPRIPVSPADDVVWGIVREWLDDPARIIRDAAIHCGRASDRITDIEEDEARVSSAIQKIDDAVAALWEEQTAHSWPFTWIATRLDTLNVDRKRLLAEQAELRSRRAAVHLDHDSAAAILASIQRGGDLLFSGPERQAEIIRQNVSVIEVRRDGRGVVHFPIGESRFVPLRTTCNTQADEVVLRLPFDFPGA